MIDEQELSLWIKRLEAEPSSWKNYERLSILYAIRSQLNLTASAEKSLTRRDVLLRWKMDFTKAEAEKWAAGLENSDGTTGPHWPIEQTSGIKTVGFFGEMAQAFLFDKDGPGFRDKLAAYYFGIVKAGK